MTAGPRHTGPQHRQTAERVASGRPFGAGTTRFVDLALPLFENGYEPLPIRVGKKAPAPSRWSTVAIDEACIEHWARDFPQCGIGLRTGHLVGLDIDVLDPDAAHDITALAHERFGQTITRVGLWPKRLLLYRTAEPFPKMKVGNVEFLGLGQQFVAFGRHPVSGTDYYWPYGDTPLDVPLSDLTVIDAEAAAAFLAEAVPGAEAGSSRTRARSERSPGTGDAPARNEYGLVVDGRDSWLSRIAFHVVHDALDAGRALGPEDIAGMVWRRFENSTDLARPRQDGGRSYGYADAVRKVQDKLLLARDGRLPSRDQEAPEPAYDLPSLTVAEGRKHLDVLLEGFCDNVLNWHREPTTDLPMLGIRATVGLGKSHSARKHLLALAASLKAEGLPYRILVFTASHALAEETAVAWSAAGADVAVVRGYERTDPTSGTPMCRDLEVVRAALSSGLNVRPTACVGKDGTRCRHFDSCLKQENLRDVAAAEVVVAPYDALFSGLTFDHDDIALLLIDEGCWARAVDQNATIHVEDIAEERISGMGNGQGRSPVGAMADLLAVRGRIANALTANGVGPVTLSVLTDAGLTADECQHAATLERRRIRASGLHPGVSGSSRQNALRLAAETARVLRLASLWQALGQFLAGGKTQSGQLSVESPDASGRHQINLRRVSQLHESLRGKPILYLDATLRPELAAAVLPGLAIERIDVSAPHMKVRHVQGSFSKSMLCPGAGLAPSEVARRANRLSECVDYVRWQAMRVRPGRMLVVTYKSIETALADIPNVDVAHFNAVAGLDCYRDVAMLISIGRPLPASTDLVALAGAYFDGVPSGGYVMQRSGIRMATGGHRALDVIRHEDDTAEALRAAICDDELIQVIGRGRGVNRTAANPLEVHVLADVAVPLVYDRLTAWEIERPDVFQRMLLEGVAVGSPADAAALHPEMLPNPEQAKKAFERSAFKGQNPINISYRGMSLKSASYRRAGRGRGWQRAWWIDGSAVCVEQLLQDQLGPLSGWCLG